MGHSPLIPLADAIPNHWGWFYLLLMVTFLLHLILMNFLLGGSLLVFTERLRGLKPGPDSKSYPTLVALTVNLGVPPLLFVQVLFGHYFYASSVMMAGYWISIVPILILAYYAAYMAQSKPEKYGPLVLLSSGVNTVGLLIVAFLFVNNMTMMIQPSQWTAWFDTPNGSILNLGDAMLWPRYFHMVIGAVAVAGLGRAVFYKIRKSEPELQSKRIEAGLKAFGYASIVQMLVGLWFLMALEEKVMMLFMGRSGLHTFLLVLGIALGIGLIITALKNKLWLSVGLLGATMVLMMLLRDLVRAAYMGDAYAYADLPVRSEVSPLALFLLTFIAGVALLYYMVRRVWRQLGKEEVA